MPARYTEHPYEAFGEGIHRNYAPDDLDFPSGGLWDALNIVYDQTSDNPEKMRGATQLGATIAGTPLITGLFNYNQGAELVATGDDGKIYSRTTGNFAQLTGGTGFDTTATTRWYGGMFYSATSAADVLVISNGVDAPQKYNGTAVSGLSGAPATGKYGLFWRGRWWLFTGDTAYYSVVNDCEDWSGSGSGNIQIARGTGAITGAIVFAGDLFIFKEQGIYRLAFDRTISSTEVRPVDNASGTVSHGTIQEAGPEGGGYLMFMSAAGIEALIPTDRYGNYVVRHVDDPVDPLLEGRNTAALRQAWGHFNARRKEYYLWYPSGTATIPKRGLIANTARRDQNMRFTRTDRQNLTAGCRFLDEGVETQVVGNNAGQVFQMQTGDDWAGEDYAGRIYTRAYTQGRPGWMKKYGWVYASAEAEGTYGITVRPILGRRNLPLGPGLSGILRSPSGDGWGVGEWGEAYWGDAALAGQRIKPQRVSRGSYLRLQVETLLKNQWFKFNGLTIASTLRKPNIAA